MRTKSGLCFLILVLLAVCANAEELPESPILNRLPAPFSRFSTHEALAQVFPSYNRKTGRQSEFPNQKGQPALVGILEAKPWSQAGKKYLVLFVELGAMDQELGDLCGNCAAFGLLAVLREEHGRLRLTARQETGPFQLAQDEGGLSGPRDAVFFSGHDQVSLDLAPYKLTREERLLGLRIEHMWIPAFSWSTSLTLFRMAGKSLKPVFEELVIDREFPEGHTGPVVKTTAVLSSKPAGRFHDLVIDRTTVRCPADEPSDEGDFDCTPGQKDVKMVGKSRERWSFDGKEFVRTGPSDR